MSIFPSCVNRFVNDKLCYRDAREDLRAIRMGALKLGRSLHRKASSGARRVADAVADRAADFAAAVGPALPQLDVKPDSLGDRWAALAASHRAGCTLEAAGLRSLMAATRKAAPEMPLGQLVAVLEAWPTLLAPDAPGQRRLFRSLAAACKAHLAGATLEELNSLATALAPLARRTDTPAGALAAPLLAAIVILAWRRIEARPQDVAAVGPLVAASRALSTLAPWSRPALDAAYSAAQHEAAAHEAPPVDEDCRAHTKLALHSADSVTTRHARALLARRRQLARPASAGLKQAAAPPAEGAEEEDDEARGLIRSSGASFTAEGLALVLSEATSWRTASCERLLRPVAEAC
eukprot:scaffold21.g2211.t1